MNLKHCKKIIKVLEKKECTFQELQEEVQISRGTLINVLSTLEESDCVGRRTTVGATLYGRPPFNYYLKSQCICF